MYVSTVNSQKRICIQIKKHQKTPHTATIAIHKMEIKYKNLENKKIHLNNIKKDCKINTSFLHLIRMNTKLTLKLDKNIIEKAKEYASLRNLSLSKIVEEYFQKLTVEEEFKQKLSPKVRKLSGILKGKDLNYKSELENSLRKKYLNK